MTPRMCVALDVSDIMEAMDLVERLRGTVRIFKVGARLFSHAGPAAIMALRSRDLDAFVDTKLNDIPSVTAEAAAAMASHGASYITIHALAGPDAVAATRERLSRYPEPPKLLAVTILTSIDGETLDRMGIKARPEELVSSLARMAVEAGADGVVCSAMELPRIRPLLPKETIFVTPGIRPAGAAHADQRRVASPALAVKNGASIIVVGRPILTASDPKAAAGEILAEILKASESSR